jgi:hypothetical protein
MPIPRPYAWAPLARKRVRQASHVSHVVPIDGGRAPLDTGGHCTGGGRPLISPELAPCPILGLEPVSRLSSAGVTVRNTKASVTLPFLVIPRSWSRVRLTFPTPAVCLRPPRYQGRPHSAETGGTTSGLNRHVLLTFSSTNLRPRVAITFPVTVCRPNRDLSYSPETARRRRSGAVAQLDSSSDRTLIFLFDLLLQVPRHILSILLL